MKNGIELTFKSNYCRVLMSWEMKYKEEFG